MKKLLVVLLLMTLVGCGTQAESTPAPEAVSPVHTDWSKLTPYKPAQQLYTYHEGYCAADTLLPRSDYGALLPYIGKYSTMEMYVIDTIPLYGLVTDKGELVSDPVYARIDCFDDFLVLYRGDPEGVSGGDAYAGGTFSRTLAAPDGRWVHELTDSYYVGSGCGLLMTSASDGPLDLWNADGDAVVHFDDTLFTEKLGEDFLWDAEGGPYVEWTDDRVGYITSYSVNGVYQEQAIRLYLDFSSGTVSDTPPEGYPDEIDYAAISDNMPEPPVIEGCNYLNPITDQVTGKTYFYGFYRGSEEEQGFYALFDTEGRMLVKTDELMRFGERVIVQAGLCSTVENDSFCFRRLTDNELVFCYTMHTNSD